MNNKPFKSERPTKSRWIRNKAFCRSDLKNAAGHVKRASNGNNDRNAMIFLQPSVHSRRTEHQKLHGQEGCWVWSPIEELCFLGKSNVVGGRRKWRIPNIVLRQRWSPRGIRIDGSLKSKASDQHQNISSRQLNQNRGRSTNATDIHVFTARGRRTRMNACVAQGHAWMLVLSSTPTVRELQDDLPEASQKKPTRRRLISSCFAQPQPREHHKHKFTSPAVGRRLSSSSCATSRGAPLRGRSAPGKLSPASRRSRSCPPSSASTPSAEP